METFKWCKLASKSARKAERSVENKLQMLLRFMQKWLLWLGELGEDVTVGVPMGFFYLVKEFDFMKTILWL